jgi:hypothetical protein
MQSTLETTAIEIPTNPSGSQQSELLAVRAMDSHGVFAVLFYSKWFMTNWDCHVVVGDRRKGWWPGSCYLFGGGGFGFVSFVAGSLH